MVGAISPLTRVETFTKDTYAACVEDAATSECEGEFCASESATVNCSLVLTSSSEGETSEGGR